MTKRTDPRYHVALSYAGEDREYVAQVAAALAKHGVRYFYDQEQQVELWGTHLTESLEKIYLEESACVLIFISEWYAVKSWPTQERRMAIIRAMEDPESVIPVRFDDTQVRGILPDIVTMSAVSTPPEVLAQQVVDKLAKLGVFTPDSAAPAPKIALPAELTYLLSMLRPSISQFTYQHDRFQGPSLASMHVRQTVTDQTVRKPVEDLFDDDRLFNESRMLTGLAQPFDDVLGLYDHLVIEGAAGHGKTTLGRHVALELTRALLEPESAPRRAPTAVPLMLPARVLANYISSMPWEDALLAAAREEYGNHAVGPLAADVFTRRVAGLPWLIIVDALDEIPEEDLCDRLLAVLAGRMTLPDNPAWFLITSRPLVRGQIAHLAGPLTGFYQLEPFDEEGLRRLAYKWFAREGVQTAEDFLSQVQEAGLAEVLRVPLLASIAADVFEGRPDRILPASRYQLYEECIVQLGNRREARRADVLATLAQTANGAELAKSLECDGDELLEKLAGAYITGQTSLRTVLRAALPMPVSPDEEGKVVKWLSDTGLLNPAGGRLRFLHQTFAEHLHANARARCLPAFQPGEPAWEALIRGVLMEKDDDERVLLHYLHRDNRDQGAVLSWLQQGTYAQREAASRLIIAGAPFHDAQLAAFLEFFAKAVAIDGVSQSQLTAMTALMRHPPVAALLVRLMCNDMLDEDDKITIADVLRNTPDGRRECPRRLEQLIVRPHSADVRRYAAEVLAKFGQEYRERAGAVLVELACDPIAFVDDRMFAADALLKLGDMHREVAIDVIRAVVASPAEHAPRRINAAVALAKVGPEYRAEAADALLALAGKVGENGDNRLFALKELAKLGSDHRRTAGKVLREWAEDPEASRHERAFAFAELAGVERAFRHQAADNLIALTLDGTAAGYERVMASDELLKLGSEYRSRAADGYLAVLDDSTTSFYTRWGAAENLIKLGGEQFAAQGARAWRKLATDPSARGSSRYDIHVQLAALDDGHRPEAARALAEFAASPAEIGGQRRSAALALANLGSDHLTQTIEIFVRQLDDPASSPAERMLAGMVLAKLTPGTEDVVAALLFQIASAPTAAVDIRFGVASALAELGPERVSRRRLLHQLSRDRSVGHSDRVAAVEDLLDLGDHDAGQTLIELLADSSVVSPDHQVTILRVLGRGSRSHRDLAVQLLVELCTDAAASYSTRTTAAHVLTVLDEGSQADAARAFSAIAADDLAALHDRLDSIDGLARLGAEHRAMAADVLRAVASSPALHHADTCLVAQSLAGMGQEYAAEATDILVSLAGNPEAAAEHRRDAVEELLALGSVNQDDLVRLLTLLAEQLDPLDIEHALAQLARAEIDPAHRPAALESLYHIASSQQVHLVDRRRALEEIIDLAGDFGGRLGPMLVHLAADPVWEGADRVRLCGRLAAHYPDHRARALAGFRGVAHDSAAGIAARVEAAEWLKRLGNADAAITLMRTFALEPGLRMPDRRSAAKALAQHCGSNEPAIALLTEIAESETTSASSRRTTAEELITMGPQGLAVATSLLGTLARDPDCDDWNRYWAAVTLMDLGSRARVSAAEALVELSEASGTQPLVAAFALAEAARFDEAHHLTAVEALTSVRTDAVERLQAIAALLRLSGHHVELAAGHIRQVAEDGSLRCWERRLAVG
ncbi:MAG TPA: TIR domain-containing protein, partial [Lentzea sp.]